MQGEAHCRGQFVHRVVSSCISNNVIKTYIEAVVAAVNMELLYVPYDPVLSLHDDHIRMNGRIVSSLSFLQQHNNPKMRYGP